MKSVVNELVVFFPHLPAQVHSAGRESDSSAEAEFEQLSEARQSAARPCTSATSESLRRPQQGRAEAGVRAFRRLLGRGPDDPAVIGRGWRRSAAEEAAGEDDRAKRAH